MSSSPANCDMMRGSRCIPLLVQLLHLDPAHPANPRPSRPVRARAARSLHNIVHAHPADKHCKREAKVLKLLEVLRQYSDFLRDVLEAVRIILYFDIFVPLFQQILSKIVHFVTIIFIFMITGGRQWCW